MSFEPDLSHFTKPDPHVQIVDRRLGLSDERPLGGDLVLQAGDQSVDGVDLSDGVADLRLNAFELVLVVDLLPDAAVVRETSLVDGGRIARIAVDGRSGLD